ncbi:MAG: tyrosine-type recombinase/integrase [Tepidiformaceae bacterium]
MKSPSLFSLVDEFLAVRRDLGFDVETLRWLLRDFGRYTVRIEHRGPITIDLAVRWALSSRSGEAVRAERRLWAVRQFARYRAAFDPTTEIPPAGLLGRRPQRKQPHIYSDAEICALLSECNRLRPPGGLCGTTYVTYFSLLTSCGLRLSEACRLRRRDVDLSSGLLTVRESKFRKSRIIPLHPTAVQALARYAARRDALRGAPRSDLFFRTNRSPGLSRTGVEKTFGRLRKSLGWTAHGRARRPRIHDLRHTFAVRRLLRWYEEGVEVDRKILALATYLGHAKVTDTYWYLSAVPELMAMTSQRFEHFAQRRQESAS